MKQLVLDASIVSKWFIEEQHTNKALQIRDLYAQGKVDITLPVLILFELGNVLLRHPSITLEASKRAFEIFLDLGIKLKSFVETEALGKTLENSRKFNITFYDASYVTLSKLQNAKLVTEDKKLYDKIKNEIDVSLLTSLKPEDL